MALAIFIWSLSSSMAPSARYWACTRERRPSDLVLVTPAIVNMTATMPIATNAPNTA